MKIWRLLPRADQMALVGGTVTAVLFTWTALAVTQDVASRWRLLLDLPGLAAAYAYSFLAATFETLLVTGFLIVISTILPRKILRDDFGVRGSLVAASLLVPLIGLTLQPPDWGTTRAYAEWLTWSLGLSVSSVLLGVLVPGFRRLTSALVERLSVLIYVYAPVALVSIAYVVARNVLRGVP